MRPFEKGSLYRRKLTEGWLSHPPGAFFISDQTYMWTWAGQLPHGSPSPTGGFCSWNIYQQYPIPHSFHAVLWKLYGIYKYFTYLLVLGKIKMSLLQKPLGEVSCVWVWTPQWTLLKSGSTSPASDTQPCPLHTYFRTSTTSMQPCLGHRAGPQLWRRVGSHVCHPFDDHPKSFEEEIRIQIIIKDVDLSSLLYF